ncbi:hypothetical protein DPMN_129291 [Dreissena polymorpha]|uniref:Uncharacterized protein n=1 Tax=Dreissena polymorpha TaxID=45954 RepID=A0A9D4H8T0_DREPO|nr:hypothetical protein DPMN_129291 [Dreissena polymorpha]
MGHLSFCVAYILGGTFLMFEMSPPVLVLVYRSFSSRNSVPSAAVLRVTSSQLKRRDEHWKP